MPPLSKTKAPVKPAGADLRTFFGGGGGSQSTGGGSSQKNSQPKAKVAPKKGSKKNAILISSSEEDDEEPTASPPKRTNIESKPATARNGGSSLKRKKGTIISTDEEDTESEEVKASPPKKKAAISSTPSSSKPNAQPKATPSKSTSASASKSRPPARPKKKVVDDDYENEDDDEDADDADDDYMEVDDDDEPAPKKKTPAKPRASTNGAKAESSTKAKMTETKAKTSSAKTMTPKAKEKEDTKDKNAEPAKPKPKPNWIAIRAARMAGPSAPGSKPVPEPSSPDCLAGLSFVFTGELSSFSREEAIDLAKRFGGRVVGQPSSKTSYVVLGEHAGQSKLNAIAKHKLLTINEDEFLNLIATREGPSAGGEEDEKTRKKREKEEKAIKESAKEMERREKAAGKAKAKASGANGAKMIDPKNQLWTDRYAPQTLKEICGNKVQVERLQNWLNSWSNSLKSGFKKPGKDGMNIFRGVMVSGPPGVGKTTSAHLVAKLAGFTPIELNASDARSKKLVENSTNITNTSLDGWMGGGETTNAAGVTITEKSCLIMDEVDGMSAGDRGGVGALAALIRKTKIPIICIANDRSAQKMAPLTKVTFDLKFRRPDAAAIRSRIMTIAFKEKMKIPAPVIDQLVTGVNSDIRQVLNMLSTWKLSSDTMDFDESKTLANKLTGINRAKMNEKYAVMTPFNIIQKMLGPYMFGPTSRETLGDKMELYFQDYSFVPLFVQENYLKTSPVRVRNEDGPMKELKLLDLMEKASESISDGDLVDALIHGPEQHWTLMPVHAVLSTVRPASFLYGPGQGYAGPNAMSFPQFLGQNSKQNKLSRQLGDIQIHMRLKVSGDKNEIRQSYVPALFPHLVRPLMDRGASAVDDVIDFMDEYFLSREDLDTIVEVGVGDRGSVVVSKEITKATETAMTKKYNAREHPILFHRAQDLGKVPKKLAGGPAPDLEEAFDADDVDEVEDDKLKASQDDDEDDDIKNDKLIKQAGVKAKKGAAAADTKGKGKAAGRAKGKK